LSDLIGFLDRDDGSSLPLWPGREVVARVVRVSGGRAVLSLAGAEIEVAAEARLVAGATVRLRVERVAETRIALRVVGEQPGGAGGVDRRA
jgi:hypothetical protein